MTRVLVFDGPHATRRFDLLRLALLSGGDGKGDRTPPTIRKEARLLDAFDAISMPGPPAQVNGSGEQVESRLLKPEADDLVTLTLTQEDFDLLTQYSEKTAWTPRVSRQVVDLWDWLSAAERRD